MVRLKVGCQRDCVVRFAGQKLDVGTTFRSFMDAREVDVDVPAGTHELSVTIKPQSRKHTLFVRLHTVANAVPTGVQIVAPKESSDRVLVDGLPVRFETRVVDGELRVDAVVGPGPRSGARASVSLGDQSATTRGESIRLTTRAQGSRTTLVLTSGRATRTLNQPHRIDADAIAAIQTARDAVARSTALGQDDARATVRYGAEHLEGLLARADKDTRFIRARTETITRQATDLGRGIDPLDLETGVAMRAYRSPLDGRDQVYALYVPPSWRPGKRYGVVVSLHPSGFHPLLSLRSALGHAPRDGRSKRHETRHFPAIRDQKTFVIAPYGYRGTGSRYFGKTDVLAVLDRVQRRYGTDPRRVTLSGGSLGGLGTWHIGLRMPDRFASLMPMAGYGSVQHYKTVRGITPRAWEKFLIQRRDNLTFVENAMHLPMLAIHGDRDNPRRSTIIVNAYKRYGYRHRYEELLDTGHNAWDPGYAGGRAIGLNRKYKTPRDPRKVRFVSGSYHHREAYGARIDQFERHDALARISSRVVGDTLRVTTENVRRITLSAHADKPVLIDGQTIERSGPVSLARTAGKWAKTSEAIPAAEKQPGRSGPIDDVRYTPHVFVYGTLDASQTQTNRRRAEHAARYWFNDAEIHMPVVADVDLSPSDLSHKNLILFGNNTSNTLVAKMASRLPVQWTGSGIRLGQRTYNGASVGISFIYPNPLTAGKTMVVIHAGTTHRGTWLSGWLPRWLPDFVVYDSAIEVQRGGRLMDKRQPLAGGYFDRNWRLGPAYSTAP